MKKKFFNSLILIGLIMLALFVVLGVTEIFSFTTLGSRYAILVSLLILFVGLSNAFKKFTDYNEGTACLKRAVKSLNLMKFRGVHKVNHVRVLSVKNQINNARVYIGNVADKFDLYELRSDLKRLASIEKHYTLGNREALDAEIVKKDIEEINESLDKLKRVQSKNVMIS